MNRAEARLIAEELHKLLRKDVEKYISKAVKDNSEEWLSTEEAARLLGVSLSYMRHNDIPHTKVGRINKYKKSDMVRLLNR